MLPVRIPNYLNCPFFLTFDIRDPVEHPSLTLSHRIIWPTWKSQTSLKPRSMSSFSSGLCPSLPRPCVPVSQPPSAMPPDDELGLGGRASGLAAVSIVGPVLACILVTNRMYWRLKLVRTLGGDDLWMAVAQFFLFAMCIANIVAIDYGYGQYSKVLKPQQMQIALKMFWFNQITYKVTINCTKISILQLYLRIFNQTWFRRLSWMMVGLVAIYASSSIVVTILQCYPVNYVWDKTLEGTCIDLTAFWYANASYNIGTDAIIVASVPFVVWALNLPTRQRVALICVFGLVVFVFTTSMLRMTTLAPSSKATDPTYGTLTSTMWTTVEACTAIVCACLPVIRTPLQMLFPRLFPSSSRPSHGSETPHEGLSQADSHARLASSGRWGIDDHTSRVNDHDGSVPRIARNATRFTTPKTSPRKHASSDDLELAISPANRFNSYGTRTYHDTPSSRTVTTHRSAESDIGECVSFRERP